MNETPQQPGTGAASATDSRTDDTPRQIEVKLRHTPVTTAAAAAWDHPRVLVCALATLLAMPLMLIGIGQRSSSPRVELQTAAASYHQPAARQIADSLVAATTTTTTVAATSTTSSTTPPSTTPSTTTPKWTPPSTTVPAPKPATPAATTAAPAWQPPATTAPQWTPPPAPVATNSESGIASYYADPNGGCAHKTLPFGTVVHITASNGRTATCVVDDRGPFGAGRILDLDKAIFAQLAPMSQGVVQVTATW